MVLELKGTITFNYTVTYYLDLNLNKLNNVQHNYYVFGLIAGLSMGTPNLHNAASFLSHSHIFK